MGLDYNPRGSTKYIFNLTVNDLIWYYYCIQLQYITTVIELHIVGEVED